MPVLKLVEQQGDELVIEVVHEPRPPLAGTLAGRLARQLPGGIHERLGLRSEPLHPVPRKRLVAPDERLAVTRLLLVVQLRLGEHVSPVTPAAVPRELVRDVREPQGFVEQPAECAKQLLHAAVGREQQVMECGAVDEMRVDVALTGVVAKRKRVGRERWNAKLRRTYRPWTLRVAPLGMMRAAVN